MRRHRGSTDIIGMKELVVVLGAREPTGHWNGLSLWRSRRELIWSPLTSDRPLERVPDLTFSN
jgi:hypothetical protein